MDPQLVVSIMALAVAVVIPLLSRRDLLTKLAVQEEARKEWRESVIERLESLEQGKESSEFAAMQAMDRERERNWTIWRSSVDRCVERLSDLPTRTTQTEHFITELREWKHVRGEPHVMAMIALEKRVERIERHLNGHLK
jgi:chromatin segregation and condensation protein Rec8/ScpA/Scc1 (kleisin family)